MGLKPSYPGGTRPILRLKICLIRFVKIIQRPKEEQRSTETINEIHFSVISSCPIYELPNHIPGLSFQAFYLD